jgi:hypothetical protein
MILQQEAIVFLSHWGIENCNSLRVDDTRDRRICFALKIFGSFEGIKREFILEAKILCHQRHPKWWPKTKMAATRQRLLLLGWWERFLMT